MQFLVLYIIEKIIGIATASYKGALFVKRKSNISNYRRNEISYVFITIKNKSKIATH